jgi:hypothetical protein
MVAVDFARILSAASLQADRDTFAPGRLQLTECFLQRHDADALPSRRDCGAFGIIPMLTSLDLPGAIRYDMSKDTSYNDCKRLFARVKGMS